MENRTKSVKLFAEYLKKINSDDYPAIKENLLSISNGIASANELFSLPDKIRPLLLKYLQELNISTDEQFQKELNCSKADAEQVLNSQGIDLDIDRFYVLAVSILKCKLNKAEPDSKEELSVAVAKFESQAHEFDEFFNTVLNNTMPAISENINLINLKKAEASNLIALPSVPILLKKNEQCYTVVKGIELYEDRAVRESSGGYDGFSFRIMKGVYYRTGMFGAKSKSHTERTLIDKGTLYVTNQRCIFDGESKNITIPFKELISVEAYDDGLGISRENKKDSFFLGKVNWHYVGSVISAVVNNAKNESRAE